MILLFVSFFTYCSPEENNIINKDDLEKGVSSYWYSPLELEILDLVNLYRISQGRNELEGLDQISRQAYLHNEHMITAREVCHHNFGKRYWLLSERVGARAMGENVGYGYSSAGALVKSWIKSEGHRKILEGSYNNFGVSAREGEESKIYFTLIFVRR
ncbi:CAP domain-containing protein [Salinimicrobium sp. CAU 1759]